MLVVDGLDDARSDVPGDNPLPNFLPYAPPPGVFVVCASRPQYPTSGGWRRENVRRIDLDAPAWAASNEGACAAFWGWHAPRFAPPLERALVVSASNDRTLKVWDLEAGRCFSPICDVSSFVCVSASNHQICVGDADGNLWVLDLTPTPMTTPTPRKALRLFFSYAYKDEPLLEALKTHLAILKRQGLIET